MTIRNQSRPTHDAYIVLYGQSKSTYLTNDAWICRLGGGAG